MSFIITHTGRRFYFIDPRPDQINTSDIAWALAHSNRFTGHAGQYSTLTHSLHVARILRSWGHANSDIELDGLIHDCAEAYIGDVSSPLKRMLPDYQAIEARVDAVVRAHFGLGATMHPEVKRADAAALADEGLAFFGSIDGWGLTVPPSGVPVTIESPIEAMERWLYNLAIVQEKLRCA